MNDRTTRSTAAIDDELAGWLLAHDRGLTEREAVAFDGWLARSPVHGRAWSEAAPLWESFDHAEGDETIAAMLEDARAATPDRMRPFDRPRRIVVGGGLLLAAALTFLVAGPKLPLPVEHSTEIAQNFTTGRQAASYRLADGTQLTLDAGSTLSFASRGNARIASLTRGRAFLDVHHDTERPFSVEAGGATITDEGTRFGVASEEGALSVTLVSGKVAIFDPASGSSAIALVPGQQFDRIGNAPGTISTQDANAALAWRTGYLEFDRVPLTQAIAEINRYTADPLQVGDPQVGQFLVSGRFKAGDPQRFARVLALTYPVRLETDPRGRPTLRLRH